MNFFKTILTAFVFLIRITCAYSQNIERFNSFSYSVNEGLLQTTINDIAFDKNNFCWLSFPNGIQKFDGKNFITVPVQPGLPDDKFVWFFRCRNGNLFLSHTQGISRYEINSNRFEQVYTKSPAFKNPIIFIGEDGGAVYFYNESGEITGINSQTCKMVSMANAGLPAVSEISDYKPKISDNIINHKVVLQIKSRFYLWDLQNSKLISKSDSIPDASALFLRLKTANELLYNKKGVYKNIFTYNFNNNSGGSFTIKAPDVFLNRTIIYPWKNKILASFDNRLYEIDTTKNEVKAELVNFQNKPVAGNLVIAKMAEDNAGNLYLQTITGGIIKVIKNNYPIKYYGTEKKEENNIISILPDKTNNRILCGTTGRGLLIFDTLQHLVKHIRTLPGSDVPFSVNIIVKNNAGDYQLFSIGEKNTRILKHDLSRMYSVSIVSSIPGKTAKTDYFGNFLFLDAKKAFVQSQGKIYKVSLGSGAVTEHEFTSSYTMGALWYNSVIISHANDQLIFLDTSSLKEIKKIPFKNTGQVRCFAKDKANNIYLGCNKGIFKIDSTGNILFHLTRENGLPDECIYAMVFDEDGFLWCSTNKGVFRLNKNNSILQLTREDGLQENEFNTNVVSKAEDGELFFGGVNGVSSFYPKDINGFEEKINILVTKIKVNNEEAFKDTAVWNIEKIKLPYNKNSLSFDFIAMANNNPGQYVYQYRMEGIDKEWIQNDGLQTVRYFLPPGTYTFKIYASRFFEKNAIPMKEIKIVIDPPFWKTWWFIIVSAIIALAVLAYSINRYNKNKYQKKLAVLEGERKIQQERERISRDLHDSIGAYANAVLYNTELLEKDSNTAEKEGLMKDLKFASKDIITSLRETVWALKKDNYTAEDCLLRIKNFIQALARYYPQIHFKVEGEAPEEKNLHHTKALNAVRIIQEAVTNAIKHASALNIGLISKNGAAAWELIVFDDGKGFNYEAAKNSETANGLVNMKQRAAESGFEFSITSSPENGTRVNVVI